MSGGNGKIVLVTGANRGIGRETARQLAERGWQVIIGARDHKSGAQAVAEIAAAGGAASFLPLDVSDSQSIQAAAASLAGQVARLDVLINNAGIYIDKGVSITDVPRNMMERTFATNTFGALEVAQAMLPLLRKSSAARVVNVSSGYGELDGMSPDVPSYCLSKLALNGVTILLAKALAADNIAVNSMCPGWVRTDMGGADATRSVEQGADTAVWLTDEAPQDLTGRFIRDRKEIEW